MQRKSRVVIIGGGIGGLTAALALTQRGIETAVYEQAGALNDIGAGIQLGPNAVKTYRALGIEAGLHEIGFETENQVVRSWRSGRIISKQARKNVMRTRFGAPYYTAHRADLLDLLHRKLPADCVRLGARCIAVTEDARGPIARFADGGAVEADVIVGADGIHSVVRTHLFGAESPRFTGCICWRGLVPMDAVPKELGISDGTAWWGPHGHIVHYPVRRGELMNFVAHLESAAWTNESWTTECEKSELLEAYSRWNEALLQLIDSSDRYYKWALYDRDPLDRWSQGRITLLGDAAHAMLPYLAQGACMAIEDAYVLAESIMQSPQDLAAALAFYETMRVSRARRTVLGSRFRARENHLASPWKRFCRDVKIAVRDRFASDNTSFRAAWLYDYDAAAEFNSVR